MKLHRLRSTDSGIASFGCIWDKGQIPKDKIKKVIFHCINEDGIEVDIQSRITAYWPDGSIKWTNHCADNKRLSNNIEVNCEIDQEIDHEVNYEIDHEVDYEMDHEVNHEISHGSSYSLDHLNIRTLEESVDDYKVHGQDIDLVVSKKTDYLFKDVRFHGQLMVARARAVLKLEEPSNNDGYEKKIIRNYEAKISNISLEEAGPVQIVFKFEGIHTCKYDSDEDKIPFVIRMFVELKTGVIRFQHTFLYDADENKDFLKGIGIVFESPVSGPLYNRHIKYAIDKGMFHEASVYLNSWRPRIPEDIYMRQMSGDKIIDDESENIGSVTGNSPCWDSYFLNQDSPLHFRIHKKLPYEDVCYIDSYHGTRARGAVGFGNGNASVMIGIRDFWQKYPAGLEIKGLSTDMVKAYVWFYSPEAESYDFRHYAKRGYNQVCYEGYDYKGADPVGIACTSECAIGFDDKLIMDDHILTEFIDRIDHPQVYVADPLFYHEKRAFGYWSLVHKETEVESWIEDQLDRAFSFYQKEVDSRNWYGLFNYGDFMHTYDKVRHQWKYDVGGYAWDNTELVPTLWLWNFFLRTGREDVFDLAEKLSRHASEIDVYHFGRYKGLGSRHNVRHWGCPCKEARIAMAAHHRVFYYLTGDRRLEDIFEELKDNEKSFLARDPLGDFYDKEKMVYESHARSGPDWSSLVSNWMTEWERRGDDDYKNKIMTGIYDLEKAPLRLISGPDFEFAPETFHLRYIGERTTGGTHLQVCMGAPSVWMETADLLQYEPFNMMLVELGRFALLERDQQLKESKGLIGDRQYTYPFMFTGLAAYAAKMILDGDHIGYIPEYSLKDNKEEGHKLARSAWRALFSSLIKDNDADGFKTIEIVDESGNTRLPEIPWISTNLVSQWCLNVIIALDFIRDELPASMDEAVKMAGDEEAYHKA